MTPNGELKLEIHPMGKPKPLGCAVFVDGKIVAIVSLDNVKSIASRISELENDRK